MQVSEGASRSRQDKIGRWSSPNKWTKVMCHDIYSKRRIISWFKAMKPNGPAIWGGCVTRRKHRVGSWYFSQKVVTVQGGYGTCFCRPGTNFIEHYACRGIKLISETDLSKCNKCYKMDTGAVSRYKLSRSQKTVTVQDFNWVQMRESGFSSHYEFV
jgi:hypothetical protein